jgi:hypothetical protein
MRLLKLLSPSHHHALSTFCGSRSGLPRAAQSTGSGARHFESDRSSLATCLLADSRQRNRHCSSKDEDSAELSPARFPPLLLLLITLSSWWILRHCHSLKGILKESPPASPRSPAKWRLGRHKNPGPHLPTSSHQQRLQRKRAWWNLHAGAVFAIAQCMHVDGDGQGQKASQSNQGDSILGHSSRMQQNLASSCNLDKPALPRR